MHTRGSLKSTVTETFGRSVAALLLSSTPAHCTPQTCMPRILTTAETCLNFLKSKVDQQKVAPGSNSHLIRNEVVDMLVQSRAEHVRSTKDTLPRCREWPCGFSEQKLLGEARPLRWWHQ